MRSRSCGRESARVVSQPVKHRKEDRGQNECLHGPLGEQRSPSSPGEATSTPPPDRKKRDCMRFLSRALLHGWSLLWRLCSFYKRRQQDCKMAMASAARGYTVVYFLTWSPSPLAMKRLQALQREVSFKEQAGGVCSGRGGGGGGHMKAALCQGLRSVLSLAFPAGRRDDYPANKLHLARTGEGVTSCQELAVDTRGVHIALKRVGWHVG